MLGVLDKYLLLLKRYAENIGEQFIDDEDGVSAIIATVVLILIVLLMAGIFWESLKDYWDTTLWPTITGSPLPVAP